MRDWPPPEVPGDGRFRVLSIVLGSDCRRRVALQWLARARSVPVLALEGGEDQVAHVMDIALDAGEAVIIDAPVNGGVKSGHRAAQKPATLVLGATRA